MRKNLFVLAALMIAASLVAFTYSANTHPGKLLSPDCQQEFVSTTTSVQLKANIADLFSHDFDQVDRIDIHQHQTGEYYYAVFGKKEGVTALGLLNASEEMVNKQYYPNRKDLGILPNELVINCYCTDAGDCTHALDQGIVCGVATDRLMDCTVTKACPDDDDIPEPKTPKPIGDHK